MASKVDSSSFRQIVVTSRSPLKKVLESNKLKFEKGKSFYEITKSETIQDYKTLVVMRKSDGAMVTGEKVREVLNIPKTKTVSKFMLDLEEIPDFKVFVQSTSHNRVLLPDTTLLFLTGDIIATEDKPDDTTATPAKPATSARASRMSARTAASAESSPPAAKATKRKVAEKVTKVAAATKAASAARGSKRKAAVATTKVESRAPAATRASKRKIVEVAKKSPPAKKSKKEPEVEDKKKTRKTPVKAKKPVVEEEDEDEDEEEVEEPVTSDDVGPATSAPTMAEASKGPSLGVGEKVEIAFSFDTTGSMYPCLGEVRRKLTEVITRLKRDVPGIRIAIIAHGDYCDRNSSYVTKIQDFSENQTSLCNFVRDVGPTGGGDYPECYELVLRESYTKLNWSPTSQRSLVMIGDAPPHEANYSLNTQKIDWRKECVELKNRNIRIYSVQALNNSSSSFFYEKIAELTGGYHLKLDQFSSIANFMLAICYREVGDDSLRNFEEEVVATGMNRELHRLFDNLAGRTTTFAGTVGRAGTAGLTPVNPSRFQVLKVDDRISIKDFVLRNSLVFKTGRGFYEFTKPETISHKKEVVLIENSTGDMFTGPEACRLIGAGDSKKIQPAALEEFRVFVQSTSYNRVLVEDTGFLYEVDSSV